jgi:hypothetical protein
MSELWSPGQIKDAINAQRAGNVKSRDTVSRWQRRPDFPKPKMQHGKVRFYDSAEVLAWHAAYKLRNPKKRKVLDLHRADPTRSNRSIALEVGCSQERVRTWLLELGAYAK